MNSVFPPVPVQALGLNGALEFVGFPLRLRTAELGPVLGGQFLPLGAGLVLAGATQVDEIAHG